MDLEFKKYHSIIDNQYHMDDNGCLDFLKFNTKVLNFVRFGFLVKSNITERNGDKIC
jgi:hypothetical protein